MANIHLHTTRKMEKTKHTKYFSRCLFLLPAQATSYDGNRLSIVYFCLSGLDLLGTLDQFIKTDEQRKEYIEWIYKQVVESGEGFRGSPRSSSVDMSIASHERETTVSMGKEAEMWLW